MIHNGSTPISTLLGAIFEGFKKYFIAGFGLGKNL